MKAKREDGEGVERRRHRFREREEHLREHHHGRDGEHEEVEVLRRSADDDADGDLARRDLMVRRYQASVALERRGGGQRSFDVIDRHVSGHPTNLVQPGKQPSGPVSTSHMLTARASQGPQRSTPQFSPGAVRAQSSGAGMCTDEVTVGFRVSNPWRERRRDQRAARYLLKHETSHPCKPEFLSRPWNTPQTDPRSGLGRARNGRSFREGHRANVRWWAIVTPRSTSAAVHPGGTTPLRTM